MLPEDAVVLLVDADRLRDRDRRAVLVAADRIEVRDLAQAVAAERQRVGQLAETDVAGVEGVLPPVVGGGRPVGDDHLGQARPVDHRPEPVAVLVADLVDDQALDRVHRHPQPPRAPGDVPVVDRHARPVGLVDLQRRQRAHRAHAGLVVAPVALGDRHDVAVLDLQHLARVAVDDRHQVLDRAGVGVVALGVEDVGDAPPDAPAGLVDLQGEVAGRPRVDLHQRGVGDAPARHRRLPAGIGLDGIGVGDPLLQQDGGMGAGHVGHVDHRALVQRHGDPLDQARRLVVGHAGDEPGHGAAVPPEDVGLGRFGQRAVDEAHARRDPPGRRDGGASGLDLGGGQGRQRVARRWGGGRRERGVEGLGHGDAPSLVRWAGRRGWPGGRGAGPRTGRRPSAGPAGRRARRPRG